MQVDAEEALPCATAADVKRVAAAAAGAALEQCKSKIPVREGYFSAVDLGADAGAAEAGKFSDIEASESDLEVVSEDEGLDSGAEEACENDHGATRKKRHGKRSSAQGSEAEAVLESGRESLYEEDTDGDESESEEEDEGGYGQGGLSWEAVMAQVMAGGVRVQLPCMLQGLRFASG